MMSSYALYVELCCALRYEDKSLIMFVICVISLLVNFFKPEHRNAIIRYCLAYF